MISLSSRFQGGLLGAWIGASIEENNQLVQVPRQLLPWITLGINLTERLIISAQITDDDWLKIFEQQSNQLHLNIPISSGAIALATLPLALFFHDYPSQFREYLYWGNKYWKQSQETLEEVIIWQDAIALILREKLNSYPLLGQLIKRHSNKSTPLLQQLEQLQIFLEQKLPLQQVLTQLSRHPREIALACYCFSYTPEEFSLCVKRAKKVDYQPSLTAALTGILAGVYNGVSGIPIAWRGELQKGQIPQNIYRQATILLAVWSGVDQPSSLQPLQHTAIACPLIIQPRPTVKMISQTEF